MTASAHSTREGYLNAFVAAARPIFAAHNAPLPERIRVGVGFALGSRKAIGQCWGSTASRDGTFEIFIHPGHKTAVDAVDTLTHELAHAADGCKNGHKAPFKRIATAVGLRGPMRSCGGKGVPDWHKWADPILAELGDWPHAELDAATPPRKPQGTRLLKCVCQECGFTFRTTARWAVGATLRCPDDDCEGFVDCNGANPSTGMPWEEEGDE